VREALLRGGCGRSRGRAEWEGGFGCRDSAWSLRDQGAADYMRDYFSRRDGGRGCDTAHEGADTRTALVLKRRD
jgi:hypothetical protein